MRPRLRFLHFALKVLALLALACSLAAQEDRWEQVNEKVKELFQRGKYTEAVPLAEENVKLAEATFGPDHPYTATSLNNLAAIYREVGLYRQAEQLFRRAVLVTQGTLGPNHPETAISLNNLGGVCRVEGRYAEAESLYKRALAIWEMAPWPDHFYVATASNNLALLYTKLGRYAAAEPLYKRAISVWEIARGLNHPDVAVGLNNLAELYKEQGRYTEAELLYDRALSIDEKALGPDHPSVATDLNNLAELYEAENRYTEAESFFKRALSIKEKALGPDHAEVALDLNNLAGLYRAEGRYTEAEPLYKRALSIKEKALGPDHAEVALGFNNLGALYHVAGKPAEAEPLFERGFQGTRQVLQHQFPFMSERERLQLLATLTGDFHGYFSFCFSYSGKNPMLVGDMFNVVLWEKGMVAESIAALRAEIAASRDPQTGDLWVKLAATRSELAWLRNTQSKSSGERKSMVHQLEEQANDLDKQLAERLAAVTGNKESRVVTWQNIRNALGESEAAVEFLRFQFYDGKKKRWAKSARYVALVVTPKIMSAPALVDLGDAAELEGEGGPVVAYRRLVWADCPDCLPNPRVSSSFYDKFWKPIEPFLGDAKTIYVSPDGVLNQVSLGVLPMENGDPLLKKYDLRIVTSTRDLIPPTEKKRNENRSDIAVLVGNPKYSLTDEEYRLALNGVLSKTNEIAANEKKPSEVSNTNPAASGAQKAVTTVELNNPTGGMEGRRSRDMQASGSLEPLPGTAAEISSVKNLLRDHGWTVIGPYEDDRALEEAVKGVHSPRVLHIATHGFFEEDQEIKHEPFLGQMPSGWENPMLRSGLYFAGADRALAKRPIPKGQDDGVLTAYEAGTMNLQGTELVVLSACETGLGEVAAGEGVFGLLRAFQEAGADSIIVSMWKVPDKETQELMKRFYKKWLSGKKDKHQALREAQLEMRDNMMKDKRSMGKDLPYYWGAFVLVGR